MCIAVTITWFRFFSYFLMVRRVSKLFITLMEMLQSTLSFLFLIGCYLTIMGTAFNMQFSQSNSAMYGSVILAMRTLFDEMVCNYNYINLGSEDTPHVICLTIHVILTHVFLVNYLIAVLTNIHNTMIQDGEYTYIKIRYLFYSKYQCLFESGD